MTNDQASLPDAGAIPDPVARLAADRALGDYAGQRGWGDPKAKVGQSLLIILAAVLGEVIIRLLGILFFLNVPLLIMFIAGISNAITALFRGRQENYLFARGLVHSKNNELYVVEWPQVTRLGKSVGNRRLTGGRRFPLHLHVGRTINIPLRQQADGTDPFMNRLSHLLKQHGRPVE